MQHKKSGEDKVPDPAETGWHLDRRIPVALISGFIMQTAVAIWIAATISANVTKNTDNIGSNKVVLDGLVSWKLDSAVATAEIKTKVDNMTKTLDQQTSALNEISRKLSVRNVE